MGSHTNNPQPSFEILAVKLKPITTGEEPADVNEEERSETVDNRRGDQGWGKPEKRSPGEKGRRATPPPGGGAEKVKLGLGF